MNLFENLLNMHEVNNNKNNRPKFHIKEYSDEQMEILRFCYNSPTNEYSYMDFDEWLRTLEEEDDGYVLKTILDVD